MLINNLLTAILWSQTHSLAIPSSWRTSVGISEPFYYDSTDLKTLKLVQVIFRHGSRSPVHPYPNDPNANFDYGVPGPAQLLTEGKKQAFELGKYLRRRFNKYLNETYLASEVYARSSDVDRTIVTGEMCLIGIFAKKFPLKDLADMSKWQPFPVHSLPKWTDNKIEFDEVCEQYNELLQNYLNSPAMKNLNKKLEDVFQLVNDNTGMNVTDSEGLKFIIDTLRIEDLHGLELPAWTKAIYPDTLPSVVYGFTEATATPTMKRLFISPLLTDMIRNMQLHITGTPFLTTDSSDDLRDYHNRTSKVYLFSGHDTTITGFLNSFNLYDGVVPGFVAAIILELHQSKDRAHNDLNQNEEGNYIVKLFYKSKANEPIRELSFPKCPNPCHFSTFKVKYANFLMDNSEWKDECKLCGRQDVEYC